MRPAKWFVVLGVVVIAGTAFSMMVGGDGSGRRSGSEIPGPTSETDVLDTTAVKPVLVGDPPPSEPQTSTSIETPMVADRTEAGALLAAVGYLEATEEAVLLNPVEAAALQRSMATTEFAAEFGADTEQRMAELAEAIPGGITLRVAPIEARSTADGDDWLVSIWYVQAITISNESVVDDWRTASYRLRWEAGAWKIADFTSERGPMPGRGTEPASATATQFEAILSGYSDDGLS